MVDLFTGGIIMPVMFVNAAATCYLLSLTAPLAFMEAWKKALERTSEASTPPRSQSKNKTHDMERQRKTPPYSNQAGGVSCGRSLPSVAAKKTRSRDHNACHPGGQAGKQHEVAQEKRHATASPFASPCSAILTGRKFLFVGYPT